MAKPCIKTFIKRGQPIEKKNLKPSLIYAVRYTLPVEVAAQLGTVQEQWGIVQFDKYGDISRTWNVDAYNSISSTDQHRPWTENMTYFRSSQMERQLMEYYNLYVSDILRWEARVSQLESNMTENEARYQAKLMHPLHRLADFIIRMLNRLKKK